MTRKARKFMDRGYADGMDVFTYAAKPMIRNRGVPCRNGINVRTWAGLAINLSQPQCEFSLSWCEGGCAQQVYAVLAGA
jgi:hypothetical protein